MFISSLFAFQVNVPHYDLFSNSSLLLWMWYLREYYFSTIFQKVWHFPKILVFKNMKHVGIYDAVVRFMNLLNAMLRLHLLQ